jgi:predicted PurR-regulated permease PerM
VINVPTWFMRVLPYVIFVLLSVVGFQLLVPYLMNGWHWIAKVFTPFFIAIMITYVLHPIVNVLHQRKVPRTLAVLLIYVAFFMSVSVLVINVSPMFMEQLKQLNTHLPKLTLKAERYMIHIQQNNPMPDPIQNGIDQAINQMEHKMQNWVRHSVSSFGATLNLFFVAMIIPFLAFYMLKDYKVFGRWLLATLPKHLRRPTYRLWLDIDKALGNYVRGQVIVGAVVGVLAYIAYWLLKLPYPLLFASLVALFNIIPYLGPFFGAAPAVLMAATISIRLMLIVIIVNTCIQVVEGNIISPQVVGKSLQMHPLAVMIALLVGGELAGVVGLILAVPAYAVIRVCFEHGYRFWQKRAMNNKSV